MRYIVNDDDLEAWYVQLKVIERDNPELDLSWLISELESVINNEALLKLLKEQAEQEE